MDCKKKKKKKKKKITQNQRKPLKMSTLIPLAISYSFQNLELSYFSKIYSEVFSEENSIWNIYQLF